MKATATTPGQNTQEGRKMTHFDKDDLLEMVAKGDTTDLRLHFESEDSEPYGPAPAAEILEHISSMVSADWDEDALYRIAYICTDADYHAEQEYFQTPPTTHRR